MAGCAKCVLAGSRTQTVYARGDAGAGLVFVGEAPGGDEDRLGLPFVGRAGKLLDEVIREAGVDPAEVFVANVVKCRPPENRPPEPDEIAACGPHLARQLELLQPLVVCALGKHAAQHLLDSRAPFSTWRGRLLAMPRFLLVVTWHPAYILRTPSARDQLAAGVRMAVEAVRDPVAAAARAEPATSAPGAGAQPPRKALAASPSPASPAAPADAPAPAPSPAAPAGRPRARNRSLFT